jgi:membrane protease YdiL (CAAX protease family)
MFEALLSYQGPLDFLWLVAAIAVAPAVCEEILFRGFVQSGLVRQARSAWEGVAATALVFGVFHLDPWRFVMVTVLGLFLGWLRQAGGSLWPAILAHALNNALTLALMAAGLVAADRAPSSVPSAAAAAALVLLAVRIGRARPGAPADRVL